MCFHVLLHNLSGGQRTSQMCIEDYLPDQREPGVWASEATAAKQRWYNGSFKISTSQKANGWISKMMVWKRWTPSRYAIVGMFVNPGVYIPENWTAKGTVKSSSEPSTSILGCRVNLPGCFFGKTHQKDPTDTRIRPLKRCPKHSKGKVLSSLIFPVSIWMFPKIGVPQNGWWK